MKRFMDLKIGDLIYIINKDCTHVGKWKVVNVSQPTSYHRINYNTITFSDGIKTYTEDFYGIDSIKFESNQQICACEKSVMKVVNTRIDCLKKSLNKTYKCYAQISDVKVY